MALATYAAIAEREGRWWTLEVQGPAENVLGFTQCLHLSEAREQARGLIEAVEDRDLPEDLEIELHLAGFDDAIEMAREQQRDAEEANRIAAASSRALVRRMLTEEQMTKADVAVVLGVSRQRVAQLAS